VSNALEAMLNPGKFEGPDFKKQRLLEDFGTAEGKEEEIPTNAAPFTQKQSSNFNRQFFVQFNLMMK